MAIWATIWSLRELTDNQNRMAVDGRHWWSLPVSKTLSHLSTYFWTEVPVWTRKVCCRLVNSSNCAFFLFVEQLSNSMYRQQRTGEHVEWPPYKLKLATRESFWQKFLSHQPRLTYITQTVLHFVASKSNLDLAKKLLEGSPPASARVRDKRGQYAIHRAAAVGSSPIVTLLLKHRSPLNATDNEGQTALHHAVAEGHGRTFTIWLSFMQFCQVAVAE